MPKITKEVCDKCGHTQEKNMFHASKEEQASGAVRFFFTVGVTIQADHAWEGRIQPAYVDKAQYWCSHCTIKAGLRRAQHEEIAPPAPTPPPTLEDMVRAIVGEVLDDRS